ncbi:hypothetical protein SC499_15605 [Peribacillus simplex]|uniref:hypothetical protein n=1 Tax=Peribacillus simplex TaxID=1478 RepID=UPI00298D60A9|nr:hypothetical protein [Peribacillus simplex]MDW7616111.1 hypothetical protein [Peribacillus simplex]
MIPRPNTATVTKLGNDSTGSIGGSPFKTINGAISAINSVAATGITILVYPGVYDETASTTLLTMGENTRVED